MAVPGDAATVVTALRLGWCMAEVRGRNRPDAPPGSGIEPPRTGHALPLQIERTPGELRIQAQSLLIALTTKLGVDGDGKTHASYAHMLDGDAQALAKARATGEASAAQQWDALAELIYKFDAYIQDTLAARSDTQSCGYQLGRAMAEAYWALDPGVLAGTGDSSAWWFLLSAERCREIGPRRPPVPLLPSVHVGGHRGLGDGMEERRGRPEMARRRRPGPVPADPPLVRTNHRRRGSDDADRALRVLRNFRMVVRVLRAFWISSSSPASGPPP